MGLTVRQWQAHTQMKARRLTKCSIKADDGDVMVEAVTRTVKLQKNKKRSWRRRKIERQLKAGKSAQFRNFVAVNQLNRFFVSP